MKIKTNILSSFLNKAMMSGEQQISEAILKFEKDGLKINANSGPQQARVMAILKPSAFKEYEEIGNVGMNDLANVKKVLDRFGEYISLKKEGNLLTVKSENKKVDIELVAETFLSTDTGEPTLEFDETFSITATKLKEIFKDVEMNKDAKIIIETEDKKVKFSNTGKYKFENTVGAPTCKGGVKVAMGSPFVAALLNLDGNLEVSIKSDYPLKVLEKTENSAITIIVAPIVDED